MWNETEDQEDHKMKDLKQHAPNQEHISLKHEHQIKLILSNNNFKSRNDD